MMINNDCERKPFYTVTHKLEIVSIAESLQNRQDSHTFQTLNVWTPIPHTPSPITANLARETGPIVCYTMQASP